MGKTHLGHTLRHNFNERETHLDPLHLIERRVRRGLSFSLYLFPGRSCHAHSTHPPDSRRLGMLWWVS